MFPLCCCCVHPSWWPNHLRLTRPQYLEDLERLSLIDDTLNRLSDCVTESPIHSVTAGRSSSRELSGTLKVMKRVEQVFQGKFVILSSCQITKLRLHSFVFFSFFLFWAFSIGPGPFWRRFGRWWRRGGNFERRHNHWRRRLEWLH